MTADASEAVIAEALIGPGHDGQAELVVKIRHPNGVIDSVTLNAECADKLMRDCDVQTAGGLRGQPWNRLTHLLDPA